MSDDVPALTPKRVVIGYNVHADLESYLHRHRPDLEIIGKRFPEVTADDLAWADVYVGFRRPPVAGWGSVRWVHCVGAGVDAFLFKDPLPDEILLTRTNEPFGPQISEYCVARALAFTQHLVPLARAQHDHQWRPVHIETLAGSRVVVLGTGEIGAGIARVFASLGCEVHGVSRTGKANPAFVSVSPVNALVERVEDAQWLVLAAPLTDDSYHVVNREVLAACRKAVLINVGRGALVDEAVLPEALDAGWLRGAALDVFEAEPLPATSPLWGRSDVIVSPHVAGLTTTAGAGDGFLECLARLEDGKVPPGVVDRVRGY